MSKFLMYLRMRPRYNIAIVLIYYLLVVLPHEQVGIFIAETFNINERTTYNQIFLAFGAFLFALYFIPILRNVVQKKNGKIVIPYLIATLIFTVISFKTLLVLNSEIIHFPQYAVLAILIFPFTFKYGETLGLITLFGALDEAYQYFYLSPLRTEYYDFNDVIIDLLGGAFGLIFIRSFNAYTPGGAFFSIKKSPFFISCIVVAVSFLIMYATGIVQIYPPIEGSTNAFLLIRKMTESFWTNIHPNIIYHVIQPLEGILILAALLFFYSFLHKKT